MPETTALRRLAAVLGCSLAGGASLATAVALAGPASAATPGLPGDIAPVVAPALAWPAGPGKLLVQTRCLICHNGELIASQRLTAAQWHKEVAKMVKWGAPLSAEEAHVLETYLARHYAAGQGGSKGGAPRRLTLEGATARP